MSSLYPVQNVLSACPNVYQSTCESNRQSSWMLELGLAIRLSRSNSERLEKHPPASALPDIDSISVWRRAAWVSIENSLVGGILPLKGDDAKL